MILKKYASFFLFLILLSWYTELHAQEHVVQNSSSGNHKELLLRMPLLSDKTAAIVESSLHALAGVERVEACYDPAVMIITYDPSRINDENSIVEHIRKQEINTSVEPLTTRDIPQIRKNYSIQTINTLNK
ncbi:MAG: hypothetical protein IPJ66_20530 [Bacteroidetes bacterium]|nr:hypothetical protein [Bacteroidota bacterium]